jgi:hypothetical protein
MRAVAVVLFVLAACGDDPIEVRRDPGDEYNRAALNESVAKFIAAKRTVPAYGVLGREVIALRPGMDETVAELAELELVTLAVDPVESLRGQPVAAQTEALATTVWPIALAPPFTVLATDGWRDPSEGPVALRDGEDAGAYVRRMCEGPFAVECKHVVPEWQGAVLGAEAVSRMTQRARTALANCEECSDPAWHRAIARWEQLDHAATSDRRQFERAGATSQWPVAGPGAEPWPAGAVVLEVEPDGDWIYGGERLDGTLRASVLAGASGTDGAVDPPLGVHLRPDARVETLAQVVVAAASAGFPEVHLQARADVYPWELRSYRIATSKKPKLGRPTDTIQVYLRSITGVAAAPATPR